MLFYVCTHFRLQKQPTAETVDQNKGIFMNFWTMIFCITEPLNLFPVFFPDFDDCFGQISVL